METIKIKKRTPRDFQKCELEKRIHRLKEGKRDKMLRDRLTNVLDELQLSASVKVRIKSVESALEKINRRQFHQSTKVSDLLGGMIITHTNDLKDVYAIEKKLSEKHTLLSQKDYYKHPKKTGYRSLHLTLKMQDIGVVEIQIDTIGMSKAQEITHDSLYKNQQTPAHLFAWMRALSKRVYDYYSDEIVVTNDYHKNSPPTGSLLRLLEQERSYLKAFSQKDLRDENKTNSIFREKVLTELTQKIQTVEKRREMQMKSVLKSPAKNVISMANPNRSLIHARKTVRVSPVRPCSFC